MPGDTKPNSKSAKCFYAFVCIIGLVYFLFILASAAGLNIFDLKLDFTRAGQFGDSLGALMGMIAAVSAIAAYRSQSEELLRLKNAETGRQKSDDRRDFENTFFNLIKIFREQVQHIDINMYGKTHIGTDAFKILHKKIEDDKKRSDSRAFANVYKDNKNDLGHYFRLFYHILNFVHETNIDNKVQYIRILRSLLSNSEMLLIALNCIYGSGNPKLKKLIEDYAMIHNVSSEDAKNWSLTKHLRRKAFGEREIKEDGSLSY